MKVEEIKAMLGIEPAEGEEDTRVDRVISEIEERDAQIKEAEDKIIELTAKVSEMAEANAKLVEQIKYVEPEKNDEDKTEDEEFEFADFSEITKED